MLLVITLLNLSHTLPSFFCFIQCMGSCCLMAARWALVLVNRGCLMYSCVFGMLGILEPHRFMLWLILVDFGRF